MAVTTTKEFLALCRKSDLLTAEQLAETEGWIEQTDDPKRIAATLAKREWVTRWQAHQLLNGRSTFVMGKYKLINLLGRRGMGNVFLSHHTTMNRPVALKIVSKKIGRDPQLLKRFLDEARAIATLDHDNIVRAYSVDKEGDCYYIVMEYVEGKDLRDIVQHNGPLDSAAAADYVRQAAAGLDHAHEKGVIHGDIKPSSLVVTNGDTVKILDVGISEFTFGGTSDSGEQKDLEPEAVDFLAPELTGDNPQPDPRSDIYSLGCTLYYLLTGRPPFPAGSAIERMEKHRTETPESILKSKPDVSKNLAKVCRKMMSRNPDERFRSADVVQRVLAEIIQMDRSVRRKSADQAAPAPPREASAAAAVKANGGERAATVKPEAAKKPVAVKVPDVVDKKEKPTAAKAAPPAKKPAPAPTQKQKAAPPPKKAIKQGNQPDFNFIDDPAAATVSDVPAIQVGQKRRKKAAAAPAKAAAAAAPAATAATAAAAPAADAAEAAEPPKRRAKKGSFFQKYKMWIVIGAAAAIALMMVGIAVPAIIYALSGSNQPATAAVTDDPDADGSEPQIPDDSEGVDRDDEGGAAARDDEGGVPGRDDEGGGTDIDDEAAADGTGSDPLAPGTSDGTTGVVDDGTSGTVTDETDPGTPDEPGGGTTDNGTSGESTPANGGTDTEPDGGETTEPTPPDPTPPGVDPPPDEPKEPVKPPEDKPKPPPKPQDPFKNFKPNATLLAADAEGGADPQKLAAVAIGPQTIWFVTLLGGEDVGKGKQLKLSANGEDGQQARWALQLYTPAKGVREEETEDVGDLWYEGNGLMFQWTKASESVPDGAIQGCMFQIDVESDNRVVALIEPKMVEPISMNLQKKAAPLKIEFESMPNPEKLKLEVTRFEGVKEKMDKQPAGAVPLRTPLKVRALVTDAYNNQVPVVEYQVTMAAMRGDLTLTSRPMGSFASHPMVRQFRISFPLQPDPRNVIEGKKKELEGKLTGKEAKNIRGEARTKIQQGIQFFGNVIAFDDFAKNAANGKIHFRIFIDIEGRQIDVVRSEAPKPPAKGGAKKGGGN